MSEFTRTLPEGLRLRKQWVCWRYVGREGKPTKCPFNARTGAMADYTDPGTWSTFEDAVAAWQGGNQYEGVGFVFAADDPYCGVDLDHCLGPDGNLVPEAQEIVQAFDSYTEVSPSGKGVKIFIRGAKPPWAKCRSKAIRGFRETEVYDKVRFFTVTGRLLSGVPQTIEDRQDQLNAFCRRLWPRPDAPPNLAPPPDPFDGDDDALVLAAAGARNGDRFKRLFDGDTSLHGGDDSAADLALCNLLAFWTGRDAARMDRLFRRSKLYREKWEREDYRDGTIAKAIADCKETYRTKPAPRSGKPRNASPRADSAVPDAKESRRPRVLIDTNEHRVVTETIEALKDDETIFQRGGVLARVLREHPQGEAIHRAPGSAVITFLPQPALRERMTRHIEFTQSVQRDGKPVEVPAHPTQWLVAAVDARGEWPGIRHLKGVSDVPVLRADGTLCQTPGFDEQTGVLYEPSASFPPVPEDVNIDDADAAANALLEVVCDFRFEGDDHRSAWLAGLLTPLARFAFEGPSPFFLIDANVRGAGKGLLAQTVGQVVLGREMPVSSYAHDPQEMRKKITAIAIAGDRMVHLDNLEGSFGNDTLDRALTTTRWKDRILGKSQEVDLPLIPVWYGTGNNVAVAADTTRRIIHIRLDVLDEKPEERTGFRHPELLPWIRQNRPRLLTSALTVLRAYCNAGMPRQGVPAFGSFEGWSRLVREALVWVGQPDPCATRAKLAEQSDTTADVLGQLFAAWPQLDPHGKGVVIADVLADLYTKEFTPRDEASVAMRAALENLTGCPPGKTPNARQVGAKLRSYRRRNVGGTYIDTNPNEPRRNGAVWRLHRA